MSFALNYASYSGEDNIDCATKPQYVASLVTTHAITDEALT